MLSARRDLSLTSFLRDEVPCAHLKNISFNEPESDSIKEDDETASQKTSNTAATATTNGAVAPNGKSTTSAATEDDAEGIVIPREELIKTRTILSLRVSRAEAELTLAAMACRNWLARVPAHRWSAVEEGRSPGGPL